MTVRWNGGDERRLGPRSPGRPGLAACRSPGPDRRVMDSLAELFPSLGDSDPGPSRARPGTNPFVWTAAFDYDASAEDELTLRRGDQVEVLSKVRGLQGV